jgi:ABC-type transporter Mla subunit MlaD
VSPDLKAPGPFQRTVTGVTRRLETRTTLLGLVVAFIAAGLGYVAWISVNGVPFQDRYKLQAEVPSDSPILKEGDAVRIAGRLAGLITEVEPAEGDVLVTMELEPPFAPVGQDARTNVRVKSLVYLTYLEIFPGDVSNPMPEGGTISVERSGSGVDLLEVVELFDTEAREALSNAVYSAGLGVAGRGTELNVALEDLPHATREGASQLQALTSTPGAIRRSLRGAGRATSGLRGERPDDVAGTIASGSAVLGAIANQAGPLGETIELLRPVEDELIATAPSARRLLDLTATLARTLEPAVAELERALPDVIEILSLGDFIRAQVARATSSINPFLVAARPVIRALRPTVASIDPLRALLKQITDRFAPYAEDVRLASEGLISATTTRYPGGQAPDAAALRFAPIFTCHRPREAFPDPGEALGHSESC